MTWWLVLTGVVATLAYGVSCWRFSVTSCRREACEGGRIYRLPDRKVWRECRRCKGSGKRIRVGRRIFNYWYQRRREAR